MSTVESVVNVTDGRLMIRISRFALRASRGKTPLLVAAKIIERLQRCSYAGFPDAAAITAYAASGKPTYRQHRLGSSFKVSFSTLSRYS